MGGFLVDGSSCEERLGKLVWNLEVRFTKRMNVLMKR